MEFRVYIEYRDINWVVYGDYIRGYPAHVGASILPEDSYPGEPGEIEVSGLYVMENNLESEIDLVEVIDEGVMEEIMMDVLKKMEN